MKPLINIDELEDFEGSEKGKYSSSYAVIGEKIGSNKLGYSLSIVPPGKTVCPFHNHHINEEMFLILEGNGTLRFGDEKYPLKKHDIIACPPGGRDVAHQILNTGDSDLKYLSLSTNIPHEICEYPDSDKIMSMVGDYSENKFRHISKGESKVDYFDGEI